MKLNFKISQFDGNYIYYYYHTLIILVLICTKKYEFYAINWAYPGLLTSLASLQRVELEVRTNSNFLLAYTK